MPNVCESESTNQLINLNRGIIEVLIEEPNSRGNNDRLKTNGQTQTDGGGTEETEEHDDVVFGRLRRDLHLLSLSLLSRICVLQRNGSKEAQRTHFSHFSANANYNQPKK